jgi:methionyl-tRNA formyltransferase
MVVAAYGLILPQAVLDMPRLGCLNIHASLLPRWRGAAPIHRAIEAGDTRNRHHHHADGRRPRHRADAAEAPSPILDDDTTGSLHDSLAELGAPKIVEALLPPLKAGRPRATPQPMPTGATYAAKIGKAEATVDWTRPATEIERDVRAFNPFPGALATLEGAPIKLWRARAIDAVGAPGEVLLAEPAGVIIACGDGALCITELQKPGGKRLSAANFLRGMPIAVGAHFDCTAR